MSNRRSMPAADSPNLLDAPEDRHADDRDDVLRVLGRLLASPRGDRPGPAQRLRLLERLLAHGGGWWRAEDLEVERDARDELRAGLRELRRVGALEWDERAQAFRLRDHLRVPLALTLLATSPSTLTDEQLPQLEGLLPFAGLASRGDSRQAPVWALADWLQHRADTLSRLLSSDEDAAERLVDERLLPQAAGEMRRAAEGMERLQAEHPQLELGDLVHSTVQRVSALGEQVGRASLRLSRTSRDHLRHSGAQTSSRQLREIVGRLSDQELAALVQVSPPARALSLPGEAVLVDHFPRELLDDVEPAPRDFPSVAQLPEPIAVEPDPTPDPFQMARSRLAAAPALAPARAGAELFGGLEDWSEAIRLQQGLVRLHDHLTRGGRASWRALPDVVELGGRGPVARLREIERPQEAPRGLAA